MEVVPPYGGCGIFFQRELGDWIKQYLNGDKERAIKGFVLQEMGSVGGVEMYRKE